MVFEKVYEAKTGHIKRKDAQKIGEFIERVKTRTPQTILEAIKHHPKHVIYGYVFNNSDKEAAYQYRLSRVQWILREIVYKVSNTQEPKVRLFYNVVNKDGDTEYKTMEEVFSNPEFSNQVIKFALDELTNWTARYRVYKQLKDIVNYIDKKVKKVSKHGKNK